MPDELLCAAVYYHVAHCVLPLLSAAQKSLIIASGCVSSRQFWGPMNSGFSDNCNLKGAARSAPEERSLQAAALFS